MCYYGTRTDDVIESRDVIKQDYFAGFSLVYYIKQIDFIFLCFCTVIDHGRLRAKNKMLPTFLLFARRDIICDLLKYRRTQNLFVKSVH